jgi:eukaryotic-like serine/threonine-protein kinase
MFTAPFMAALAVAVIAVVAAVMGWRRSAPPQNVSRFAVAFPDSQDIAAIAPGERVVISPDGRTIAYVGQGAGSTGVRLWVRALDQLRATPLAGTEDAALPAFSPDGKRLAFISFGIRNALRVVSVSGGPAQTLTDSLVDDGGVTWSTDGYIYYDGHLEGDGLARIRQTGGNPEIASRADSAKSEIYHFVPSALPNGRGVIMTIAHRGGDRNRWDVGVLDTRSGRHKALVRGVAGCYAASGHLLYLTADGTLMAVPFDADRLELAGEAVALWAGVRNMTVSLNGILLYLAGGTSTGLRELVWVSPSGVITPVDSAWRAEFYGRPVLSPDGRLVEVTLSSTSGSQIWVKQLDRGPAQLVADPGEDGTWEPGGKSLLFRRADGFARVPADGSRPPAPSHVQGRFPDYSRDGKWIVFTSGDDIAAVRTEGDTTPRIIVEAPGLQFIPSLSPDGRWLAYMSDETGVTQVYVHPFPDTRAARKQVSVKSGVLPRWSRSGRELYFINDLDNEMESVSVAPGAVLQVGLPQRLFSTRGFADYHLAAFDVAPDGRFIALREIRTGPRRDDQLVVVQNFFEELKARVPRK